MAVPTDAELRELLEQFVCVRLVQMWDVDLDRFQFDYFMTWAVFFLHGDGTIYGRYGSRSGRREQSMAEISLAGFKAALRRALSLHRRYGEDPAATRPGLEGKQPQHREVWNRAQDIPALVERKLAVPFRGGRNEHASCIHCHMIPNHELVSLHRQRKPIADRKIWPYPLPEVVGLQMDPEATATVREVEAGSPAAAAGFAVGDQIARFGGQEILSTADLQWVLHNAGATAALPAVVRRGGEELELVLELGQGWRQRVADWRPTNLNVMNWIVGFNGRAMDPVEAERQGLDSGKLAFVVQRADKRLLGGADLRQGDIVVEVDGAREPLDLGAFTRYVAAEKAPGSTLKIVRRRGDVDRAVAVRVH